MNALTSLQQQLVVRHIGLVKMHVRRQLRRMLTHTATLENDDMLQAGYLGLIEAAGRYRPDECGPFMAYAMPYIHGAMCRYLAGQNGGLFLSNRSAKQVFQEHKSAVQEGAPHRSPLPKFRSLELCMESLALQIYRHYTRDRRVEEPSEMDSSDPEGDFEESSRQLAIKRWERYVQAMHWAAEQMRSSKRVRPDRPALIEAIVQERLLVPDPQYRTPKRVLARRFNCSLCRLISCERRLLELVKVHLTQSHTVRPLGVCCLVGHAKAATARPGIAPNNTAQTASASVRGTQNAGQLVPGVASA